MNLDRDVIYVTKKQASISIVAVAFFCIFIFMLGYFWGKQSILDSFGQKIAQESINDQSDYDSIIQSFTDKAKNDFANLSTNAYDDQINKTENLNKNEDLNYSTTSSKKESNEEINKNNLSSSNSSEAKIGKKYSASIVSFSTKPYATAFVQRLQKHNIPVHIKTRISKSASGKVKKIWYQILTNSYNSKEELDNVIEQIQKFEHIKSCDIKIN